MKEPNNIYNCDCLDGMRDMEGESVDAVVTDPPYGISFMNKGWDSFNHSPMSEYFIPIWKEALRVMKPGAFVAVMCSPRADVMGQQILAMVEAGFNMSFSPIFWTYASGFPKGMNISKAVDKKLGYQRHPTGVDKKFGRGDSGIYRMNLNGIDKKIYPRFDEPASPEAKKLDGSFAGFQPKPAVEVILIGMKPLSEKTYPDQALKNGKGITWLDDCRIPIMGENVIIHNAPAGTFAGGELGRGSKKDYRDNDKGRFPANLIVSDDILNDGTVRVSGNSVVNWPGDKRKVYGGYRDANEPVMTVTHSDSGSYSRYFDLDAWYYRNITSLPKEVRSVYPFLIVSKASQDERHSGLQDQYRNVVDARMKIDGDLESDETLESDTHPTIKPTKLMLYLITLLSRPTDIIMDPFLGSGTTAMAARMIGRRYIGFENDKNYYRVAMRRIYSTPVQSTLDGVK
jgi:DNA modification methylase